jgi:ubiquinone/menaquinone biosynthesis C-methylase UbiE
MTGPGPFTTQALSAIVQSSPDYGARLEEMVGAMDPSFHEQAEDFFSRFDYFLRAQGRSFHYAIECYLKLRESMLDQRMEFLRTGAYANTSFREVVERVYSNPEVMCHHMYGLVLAQFFWPDQYQRFRFFRENLPAYSSRIRRYLEIGGGHALYASEAMRILGPSVDYDLVDISETSIELSRGMCPGGSIRYRLMDIFDLDESQPYDFATIGEVIEHVEDPLAMLGKVRRLLRPGGHAFISTPVNAPTLDHIYLFHNAGEIRAIIAKAGFQIQQETSCYAENMPAAKAEKLKVAMMYAAFARAE